MNKTLIFHYPYLHWQASLFLSSIFYCLNHYTTKVTSLLSFSTGHTVRKHCTSKFNKQTEQLFFNIHVFCDRSLYIPFHILSSLNHCKETGTIYTCQLYKHLELKRLQEMCFCLFVIVPAYQLQYNSYIKPSFGTVQEWTSNCFWTVPEMTSYKMDTLCRE